ncbi:MAG TPA: hypothetical protein VK809_02600, partial [Bacteroidia bacterium]|nr:hypothetical protein [Bacteroidia bacterium]
GFSDKRFRFKLEEVPDCLSAEQLEKYRKYHELSIETYKKVQQLNPKYETMVGDIGLKLADEYMVAYLDMMIYQNETEAKKELKDNIYDYFMVSFAKNYLASCDSNAILITYGDNDTYPLLYVQAKYHFRTDVLIVNSSLLQTSRYINRMRRPFADAGALPLTMKPEQYKDGVRDFVVFNPDNVNPPDENNRYYDLRDIMDFISSDDPSKKIEVSGSDMVNYSPSKLFKFNVNAQNVIKSKILTEQESDDMATEIKWKFPGPYMLKDKIILLDALVTNNWKRPICFCISGGESEVAGLDSYLRMQGFAYELVPFQNQSSSLYSDAAISAPKMYSTIMHKFQWGNMGSGVPLNKGKIYMAENYRVIIGELAQKLVAEGGKDSAIKVLNLCSDSIPEKTLPFDNSEVVICEAYYAAGAYDKAGIISQKLFKIYEGNVLKYNKPDPDDHYRESSLQDAQMILEKLRYDAKSYKQDELYKDYSKRIQVFVDNGMMQKSEFPESDSK